MAVVLVILPARDNIALTSIGKHIAVAVPKCVACSVHRTAHGMWHKPCSRQLRPHYMHRMSRI